MHYQTNGGHTWCCKVEQSMSNSTKWSNWTLIEQNKIGMAEWCVIDSDDFDWHIAWLSWKKINCTGLTNSVFHSQGICLVSFSRVWQKRHQSIQYNHIFCLSRLLSSLIVLSNWILSFNFSALFIATISLTEGRIAPNASCASGKYIDKKYAKMQRGESGADFDPSVSKHVMKIRGEIALLSYTSEKLVLSTRAEIQYMHWYSRFSCLALGFQVYINPKYIFHYVWKHINRCDTTPN